MPDAPSATQTSPGYPRGRKNKRRKDLPKCTATAKSTGEKCGQDAVPGREVCRWHGGLTPSIHRATGGLHSKLPSRLAEAYSRGLADPELLDQRRSIALMESLVEEMAERVKDGDTPDLRQASALMARDTLTLLDGDQVKEALPKLRRLVEMLEQGSDGDAARDKLFSMTDRLGTRRDAAWTTKLQRVQVMNANDVALLLGMVLQRARSKWGEDQARELAEMFETLLSDRPSAAGRGETALAAIPIEGHTVNGGTHGNAASGP